MKTAKELVAAWVKDRKERERLGPQQHSLLIRMQTIARNEEKLRKRTHGRRS